MNKFIPSLVIVLGTVSKVLATRPPSLSPTSAPTRVAEQIQAERTFGHKTSSAEFGGVVAGVLCAFLILVAIGYFCCASKQAEEPAAKYVEVPKRQEPLPPPPVAAPAPAPVKKAHVVHKIAAVKGEEVHDQAGSNTISEEASRDPAPTKGALEATTMTFSVEVEPVKPETPVSVEHSTKSHKHKDSTTTTELRIFLPHIEEGLDKWIAKDITNAYKDALQQVTMEALAGNSTPEPNHEDKYVIGTANFAVKFKSGKGLELNVRRSIHPIWMESWNKTKFGKHDLQEWKPDVMEHLRECGYAATAHSDVHHIDHPKHLTVIKSKNAWKHKNVHIEVVELSVPVKPDNCGEVKRKKWFSIGVMGTPLEVEEFLLHSHTSKDLWKCFTIAKRIYAQHTAEALSTHFVPVVSGYPTWLRLNANLVEQHEVDREINPSMEALMHFLK